MMSYWRMVNGHQEPGAIFSFQKSFPSMAALQWQDDFYDNQDSQAFRLYLAANARFSIGQLMTVKQDVPSVTFRRFLFALQQRTAMVLTVAQIQTVYRSLCQNTRRPFRSQYRKFVALLLAHTCTIICQEQLGQRVRLGLFHSPGATESGSKR